MIDLYNREVIGYELSKRIDADLACAALGNAIAKNGKPKSLIFHSDRGCQYSSKKYQKMLEKNEITGSMSKPGYPYDNSCAESFFASMKKEYMHNNLYHDSVYGVLLYIADQWPLGEYSCNVRFALGTIKVLIEAIDQAE